MISYLLLLASSVLVGLLLVACDSGMKAIGSPVRVSLTRITLIIVALSNILVVVLLFINHADFPLNMEIMEQEWVI